jgi:hypothetical protein
MKATAIILIFITGIFAMCVDTEMTPLWGSLACYAWSGVTLLIMQRAWKRGVFHNTWVKRLIDSCDE